MAYSLPLPLALARAGWKVKILNSERLEPPHVTIYCKRRTWRLSLRDGTFLELNDKWSQIDSSVRRAVEEAWGVLCEKWDGEYPSNPVSSKQDDKKDDNE
jgi:hypothetical protein